MLGGQECKGEPKAFRRLATAWGRSPLEDEVERRMLGNARALRCRRSARMLASLGRHIIRFARVVCLAANVPFHLSLFSCFASLVPSFFLCQHFFFFRLGFSLFFLLCCKYPSSILCSFFFVLIFYSS
jgi:hypothetical protein